MSMPSHADVIVLNRRPGPALQPGDLVMGASELGYALGFYNPQVVDDVWLGHWTGRQPTMVVVDRWYYQQVIDTARAAGCTIYMSVPARSA